MQEAQSSAALHEMIYADKLHTNPWMPLADRFAKNGEVT